MLDLAESSPEEIFQLLEESPNTSEAVQEIKQLMNQQFSEGKKLIFLSLFIGGPTYVVLRKDSSRNQVLSNLSQLSVRLKLNFSRFSDKNPLVTSYHMALVLSCVSQYVRSFFQWKILGLWTVCTTPLPDLVRQSAWTSSYQGFGSHTTNFSLRRFARVWGLEVLSDKSASMFWDVWSESRRRGCTESLRSGGH